jgi:hypothetical protein
MRELFEKPLSDWEWLDIQTLISNEVEESQYFEFKEALPSRDGSTDPWQSGRPRVSDYARDTIAEEMAAFANAYGGVLIIGIAESDDNPARASALGLLIRDCVNCAARLEPAIRSRFDPPIQGFDLRALPSPDGNGEGVLVLRVPASSLAPHGVGRPPECYVRRGAVKEPATMRDLQNIFWETRTRNERIRALQLERQEFLRGIIAQKAKGTLYSAYTRGFVPAERRFLAFRCTCIPVQSLGLAGIAGELLVSPISRPRFTDVTTFAAFGTGSFPLGWSPKSHGARATDGDYSVWTIGDDGLLEAAGLSLARDHSGGKNEHYPGWFTIPVAQSLVMSDKLRIKAGRPDVPFIVDCQFMHDGSARAALNAGDGATVVAPDENVAIGPFVVERRADIPTVFSEIEREIWFGLGVSAVRPTMINFQEAFAKP